MGSMRSEPETKKYTVVENHPSLQFAVSSMCGWRQYMEDSHIAKFDENVSVFGVFDGHGGPECAEFAAIHFPKCLANNPSFLTGNFQLALTETFMQVDKMMQTAAGKQQLKGIREQHAMKDNANLYDGDTLSGCTANVCLITKNYIYCANAGDSRAVAAFRDLKTKRMMAKQLSHDHKPDNQTQKKRIIKAGGTINSEGRINGNLNLSRALGDFNYKNNPELLTDQQIVSSTPEVIKIARKGISFVILGCDGIWQRKSNDQMVQWIDKRIHDDKIGRNGKKILEKLFDEQLGKNADQEYGMDNMTAILIFV